MIANETNTPKRKRVQKRTPSASQASREARKIAASILEVLGGARTPTEAAGALEVSVPRYYALEARAIEGLLGACEPRKLGPRPSPQKRIAELEQEVERLERECARKQALVRTAQRAIGLPAAPSSNGKKAKATKRRRKPRVRALRAAKVLRPADEEPVRDVAIEAETVLSEDETIGDRRSA